MDISQIDNISLNALKDYSRSTNNYQLMLNCYEELLRREPNCVSYLDNCMFASVMTGSWKKAVSYGLRNLEIGHYYQNSLDGLSHAYYELEDYENCRKYGTEVLKIRHDEALKGVELPDLSNVKLREGKKIIAFSLFGGNNPKYVEGAVLNTELVNRVYPDWICRFYIDDSIPDRVIQRLKNNGSEIFFCDKSLQSIPKTMWRFLALDDESVSCVIFRDTDSVISKREADAVSDWLASGKYFNTLRDHGSNTDLIMAGLWGAKCGVLPNVLKLILNFVSKGNLHKRFADQDFLEQYLWKYIVQSLYAVDNIFDFLNPHPFRGSKRVENFIGRVETLSSFTIEGNWCDDTQLKYRLYSQIDPLIGEKYSDFTLLEKERLICEYDVVSKNGKVSITNMPNRYGRNRQYTRVELIELSK